MLFLMNKQIKSRVSYQVKNSFKLYTARTFEKVELESCDFAKKYNVFVEKICADGSGQIEARYLFKYSIYG